MRIAAHAIIVVAGVVGLIGPALAADMSGAQIKALISNKTVYLQSTAASVSGKAGHEVIYFSKDGTALYKTPSGAMWHGTWKIEGNKICPSWKEKPGTGCLHYNKAGNTVTVVATSGQTRAKILKVAPGDAEHLKP